MATRGEGWPKGPQGNEGGTCGTLPIYSTIFSKEGLRGSILEALCPLYLARSRALNQQNISCSCSMTLLKRADPAGHLLPDHCLPGQLCTRYLSLVLSQTLETPPRPSDLQGNWLCLPPLLRGPGAACVPGLVLGTFPRAHL